MNTEYSFTAQEIEEGKGMAGVAYLTLIGFIIALVIGKENRFSMYHVQQALALILLFVAASIVAVIPILGWIASVIIWIFGMVCFVIGLINGFSGKAKPLPLIGEIGFKFNMVKPEASVSASGGSVPPPPPPTQE
ncbi:hypothetical protein KAH81_10215 [bacterium]|nr:hypothetical protein [bacterium]